MGHSMDDFAEMIQSAIDGIIGKTRQGIITSWNRGAARLYGYTQDEAVGQHIRLIIPPDRHGEEQEILRRVLRGERIEHYETERVRKDGRRVTVSLTVSPIESAHGEIVGASVIARDVTERRQAEEMFRALMESAPDAMIITGSDGLIRLVNRQTEKVFGYPRDQLIGQPVEKLIPERLSDTHAANRARFFMNPKVRPMGVGLDLYAVRSDGTEFPVEISLSPIATGEGLLVSAALRDITERRRAEERFRRFLEFAPDAIVMADREGTIVEANSQAQQMFGYNREEVIGARIELLLPDRFAHRHPLHRDEYFASPQVRPMGLDLELQGKRKDGTEFPIDISLAPLETEEGILVSASIRDVSERKKAEEHARRLEYLKGRRQQAFELNDEIIQGLTVAQLASSLGQHDEALEAIERTLTAAQSIISQMLDEAKEDGAEIAEGDLVRQRDVQVLRPREDDD